MVGEAKGEARGIEIGRAEGRAEGIIEGEHKKAIEMARNALTEGLPPSVIAKLTGLSEEEIAALQQ
jgi:predicted transposase/invertase (TIGR01784 family)